MNGVTAKGRIVFLNLQLFGLEFFVAGGDVTRGGFPLFPRLKLFGSLGISVVTAIYGGEISKFQQIYPHCWGAPRQILESLNFLMGEFLTECLSNCQIINSGKSVVVAPR